MPLAHESRRIEGELDEAEACLGICDGRLEHVRRRTDEIAGSLTVIDSLVKALEPSPK